MSTPANKLTSELLIEIPKRFPNIRVWRQNTGGGVGMNHVRQAIQFIKTGQLKQAIGALSRPIKFGVVGAGDVSGVIGPKGTRFECEIKAGKDVQSPEQVAFGEMITRAGAVYVVARSLDDVVKALEGR